MRVQITHSAGEKLRRVDLIHGALTVSQPRVLVFPDRHNKLLYPKFFSDGPRQAELIVDFASDSARDYLLAYARNEFTVRVTLNRANTFNMKMRIVSMAPRPRVGYTAELRSTHSFTQQHSPASGTPHTSPRPRRSKPAA